MKRIFITRHYGDEIVRAWVWVVVVIAVIAGLGFGGWRVSFAVDRVSCEQKADAMGRKHDYGTWKGCLVQTDNGTMVPLNTFRLTHQEGSK